MCLTPIRLRTNAKYFTLDGYKKLYMDVPCGHCAECQMQRKNEWYLRNYFEAISTWNNGGYILFDTLTYDDKHLPRLYDSDFIKKNMIVNAWDYLNDPHNFSCFRYKDVQDFLKRLRINLERSGFDVANNLRFFIASEYGHDDVYMDSRGHQRKGTKRPHYHCLFYVSGSLFHSKLDVQLNPLTLASMIQDAWTNGHTDCAFHGRSYTFNNVFGPRYIKDPNRLRGVQYYVTKYVCKDDEFEYESDMKIHDILTNKLLMKYSDNPKKFLESKRKLKRSIDQFHRQSVGFGAQALLDPEVLDTIWSEGIIRIPDKDRIKKDIHVPMYYIRKLFQRCVKDSEGSLHWIWNERGKLWKSRMMEKSVDVLSEKMHNWYSNLSVYCPDDFQVIRSRVDTILEGRTFKDYARYVVYYKGRMCPDSRDFNVFRRDIVRNSLSSVPEFGDEVVYRLSSGNYVLGDYEMTFEDLYYNCMVNQDSRKEFRGFDRLYQIYCVSMIKWNEKVQADYDKRQEQVKFLKSLGVHCKKKV